jgi:hypothetical protein
MFPSEFYQNSFGLRGLEFPRDSGKSSTFGHLPLLDKRAIRFETKEAAN